MTRRFDTYTAERIGIALLTRDAFGMGAAITYALLCGIPLRLIEHVFARAKDKVRDYGSLPRPTPDRRIKPVNNTRN
ncbi:hypothetical protein [Massilia sp. BJB1822]|uniref:hypothetical protein n=1 Tax=Massilia sp. BJB1822 TaxID=2744470 RepID=UPI00159376C0|nr:hypothetical protein [Massilia sp. BJB1822]NVD97661.1 hypothetical protein [Massilia sp. BJB1822]